jgi:D-psicose/D-tagatose/L-ribulose 3-epimerase
MNRLGVHALVWTSGWSEQEARRALELTKATGFDLIEIPLLEPASVDADRTRALLEEHGLEATCSLGLAFETDISSEDSRVVAQGERFLFRALETAREIGSLYLGGVLHSAMGKYLASPSERGRRNCVDVLARLAEQAAESEITLGIEAVNRYESNLVNTAEQSFALCEEIGASNVTVHLDTYHMNIEEEDLAGAVYRCRDRLGYVHLGESHRGYLGTGSVAFPTFFCALADIGYAGPLVFESFSTAVISEDFAAALAIWRDLWDDGVDLATRARRFIEEQLTTAQAVAG